jgi:hypothetical protein
MGKFQLACQLSRHVPPPAAPGCGLRRALAGGALAIALAAEASALAAPGAAGEGAMQPPLLFFENRGQCAPEVLFQTRLPGLVASVLADGFELLLGDERSLRVRFEGSSGAAAARGLEARPGRGHFLAGADPSRWTRDVATFARVRLAGLYPGIDLELYESQGRLEYDLVLAAGADVRQAVLVLEGAHEAGIDGQGALLARVGDELLCQRAPVAWQDEADGRRRPVACAWRDLGAGRFGFALVGHDPARPLTVDPLLVYTTHVGGSNADGAKGVFVDELGEVYVAGWARSADFPPGARTLGGQRQAREAVVFKLDPAGRELRYATYLGGGGDDEAEGLAVNARGEAFVVGSTSSLDFPTSRGAFARSAGGGSDAFVLRLSADGAGIVYSTLLGGGADDLAHGLALFRDDSLTVVGTTRSRDFPVSSRAYAARTLGGRDAFVARLDPSGASLTYSTRLGGSDDDEGLAVALDETGAAYVTGSTRSRDFPITTGALDREHCAGEAFVTKLSRGGVALLYSTFLGGSAADVGRSIAVDARHRALVVGHTESADFTPAAAFAGGRRDGFAVCLSEAGNGLHWVARLGGSGADEALGVALNGRGVAWVVGRTASPDLAGMLQPGRGLAGPSDGFLVGLEPERGERLHAQLFGGEGAEELCAVHADPGGGDVALAGWADGIPPEGRGLLAGRRRGSSDALVVRIDTRGVALHGPLGGRDALLIARE